MKKISISYSDERLITPSGLTIVGNMLDKINFAERVNLLTATKKRSQPRIRTGDIFLTYIGMLCQGKTEFDAVKEMKLDEEYFQLALNSHSGIPSAETLRQRMDDVGSSIRSHLLQSNVDLFKAHKIKPTPLSNGYVPVDIDVTPFDNSKSRKEGVSRTYKGCDGYAPIMAYIGTEGYLANTELREGKQHCQKHTPDFLRETLKLCHQMTDKQLLIRLDAGNDAAVNLGILLEDGSWFCVKRNPRSAETKEEWLAKVKECCVDVRNPREGKTVYIGSSWKNVKYKDSNGKNQTLCTRIVYEVTERTSLPDGQMILPKVDVNTWWTNLGLTDSEVIELYHAHGECEQFHSEIKTDMDVERLPSGKFETNELVLELTVLAYNILRMIGQESIRCGKAPKAKREVHRRRLRTVINNLILIAGHLTKHARRFTLSLGRSNIWRDAFRAVHARFAIV